MVVDLKYGTGQIPVDVQDAVTFLNIREPEFNITKDNFCNNLLSLLTGQNFSKVGIVISDKTRLCDYPIYLPWVLEILENKGATMQNITFYIAYGTHPMQSDKESVNSYGQLFKNYSFVHHDCSDLSLFTSLGETGRGTPVLIRKELLDSSVLITIGSVSHHYFAGFGGGRKLIFPGLGEKRAIYHNHSLFLNREQKKLDPGCQPGQLEGNPIAEDLMEMDAMFPERLSLHGILNSSGRVCEFILGRTYSDFLTACEMHNSFFKNGDDETFDMVIASGGGYPKDINFIQAHKSVHHAAAFVKDGGDLVIFNECRDGVGNPGFIHLFEEPSWDAMFEHFSHNYEGNGGTALAMKAKTGRIKIHMVTSLPEEFCRIMDIHKIEAPEVSRLARASKGTLAIIRNASMLVR